MELEEYYVLPCFGQLIMLKAVDSWKLEIVAGIGTLKVFNCRIFVKSSRVDVSRVENHQARTHLKIYKSLLELDQVINVLAR